MEIPVTETTVFMVLLPALLIVRYVIPRPKKETFGRNVKTVVTFSLFVACVVLGIISGLQQVRGALDHYDNEIAQKAFENEEWLNLWTFVLETKGDPKRETVGMLDFRDKFDCPTELTKKEYDLLTWQVHPDARSAFHHAFKECIEPDPQDPFPWAN